jgi:signal transduction histidine kinase
VITPQLQVAMALHGDADRRQLLVRTDPTSLSAALALIDERLHRSARRGSAPAPGPAGPGQSGERHRHLAARFWPRLAERLAAMAPSVTLQPLVHRPAGSEEGRGGASSELALLEALTHEVRTPLATIRTLIRSLLRRQDLSPLVRQRLQQIDGECSEQIDRFGLIFHAAELQRQPAAPKPRPWPAPTWPSCSSSSNRSGATSCNAAAWSCASRSAPTSQRCSVIRAGWKRCWAA